MELRHKFPWKLKLPADVLAILLQNIRETDFVEMARRYRGEEAARFEQVCAEIGPFQRLQKERDRLEAEGNYEQAAEVTLELCRWVVRLVGVAHPVYKIE